jgi:hypothetical protein
VSESNDEVQDLNPVAPQTPGAADTATPPTATPVATPAEVPGPTGTEVGPPTAPPTDPGAPPPEPTPTPEPTSDVPPTDESGTATDAPSEEPLVPPQGPPDNAGNTGGLTASQLDPEQNTDPGREVTDGDGHPVIVPSGAAATPSTPSHVLARNSLEAPANTPQGSLDPALTDPGSVAAAGKEGRTSDPANREAGVVADAVPPDLPAGPKQSDAGPELYPFPAQGDVEVSLLPVKQYDGERMEPIYEGDFVILGQHELVPERLQGAEAAVIVAPTIICNCEWAPRTHEHPHPEAGLTVRTRDDTNATLTVPLEALAQVLRGGRITR